ncbi:Spy/CpxP family protein refolding chaperone [Desulfothermobacter acidiphilus]|uniref:Spy/CpxP family protein refolding chaperone n=1 Tax=Desulfothermobacter acidiphilus TaxID=1938353 RepID=UPI003F89EA9C
MWRNRKVLLVLSLALILAVAVPILAQAATGKARSQGTTERRFNLVQALGLTPEQLSQIRDLQQQNYNQTRDLRIKLMDANFELRQLRWQVNPDQAAIKAKLAEIKQIRDQLRQADRELRDKMEALLTPEQRQKLQSWREDHRKNPREAKKEFGGARGGAAPMAPGPSL